MLLFSIVGSVAGLIAIAGFITLAKLLTTTRRLESNVLDLSSQLDHKERALSQQRQSLHLVKEESANLSNILLLLPDLAKQLSRAHTTRELEETIVILTEKLVEAKEVALFACEEDELVLKAQRGLSAESAEALRRIKIGTGRIGWTARKRVTMTAVDFEKESNLAKASILKGQPQKVQSDICAPLIHWDRFYGVINVAGMRVSVENGRRLMNLICNLGVIALENVLLLTQIQEQADLDGLTKLYNVTYFLKHLDRELQKAQRYDRPLTVALFDLDQFDSYNQLFGRLEGDQVLRVVANLVKEGLRNVDIACRYGGEEIAIILPETDSGKGLSVVERIRKSVEKHPFSKKRITLSGGIALYPADGMNSSELMKAVESALDAAKKSGRNRIETHSAGP